MPIRACGKKSGGMNAVLCFGNPRLCTCSNVFCGIC